VKGDPDWGLPDWTNPANYPAPVGRGAMTRWAWEFLRRWPEYRTFWIEKIEPFVVEEGDEVLHDKRRLIGARWPHHNELRERFGVELPSAPCEQKPAHFMADSISCVPNDGAEVQRISLGKNQIAVILELDRPGNSQLKKASKAFKSEQHRREQTGELKLKGARARVEKYITYLRILDAYEAGAEAKNIAGVLFPTLRDEHPSYARRKRLDDDRRAALELRDGGYLSLLRK